MESLRDTAVNASDASPNGRGLENLHSMFIGSESLGVLRMHTGPLVLLADIEALSRSVCLLTPTRGSMALSLTSGSLLDRSGSRSYL